jgi:hypothetical protein
MRPRKKSAAGIRGRKYRNEKTGTVAQWHKGEKTGGAIREPPIHVNGERGKEKSPTESGFGAGRNGNFFSWLLTAGF